MSDFTILAPTSPSYLLALEDMRSSQLLAIDCETYGNDMSNKEGLHPWKGQIRLIQVATEDHTYIVDLGSRYPLLHNREEIFSAHSLFFRCLKEVLSNPKQKKVGHNIHFDLRFLRFQYGLEADNIACTMIGLMVFFGDYARSESKGKWAPPVMDGGYGLKNAAKQLLEIDIGKEEQKSDWGTVLTDDQYEYAARDARITFDLYHAIQSLYRDRTHPLYSPTIRRGWSLENQVILAAIDMEHAGMPVDLGLVGDQIDRIRAIQKQLLEEWAAICPYPPTQRDKVLLWANNAYRLNLDSLEKSELAHYADIPLFKLRRQLNGLKAKLNNLEAFQRSADMLGDGRIHTLYRTLTGFGRFSSGDRNFKAILNLQAISAKEEPTIGEYHLVGVRSCIRPPAGRRLAVIDLAGAHARIAADQSEDPTAIAGCNDPTVDNHSKVAVYIARMFGKNWTWQEIKALAKSKGDSSDISLAVSFRNTAKRTYFCWLNGGGAKRTVEQIADDTGVTPELAMCQAAIEGCKDLFNKVLPYRKQLMYRLTKTAIRLGKREFAVNHTTDGFRVVLEMENGDYGKQPPYTNTLSSTWTRIESTAVKEALIAIRQLFRDNPQWRAKLINYVHDEVDFEFDLKYEAECVPAVNAIVGDAFARQLKHVHDGRETDWKKLIVESWADK